MGQAVDLPDPAQAPAPAAVTSADDLLSQLAGEEIDRLLAESDAESAAQAEAHAAAPAAPAAPETAQAESTPAASATPAPAAESPAAATPPATENLANELDSLLSQAVANDAAPATTNALASTEAPAATESSATTAATAVDAKALDASLAAQAATPSAELQATVNEIETSLQERSGLTDSAGDTAQEEAVDDTPVPIYLKPLVWLNAPLMVLPEPIRDAIGKIAVLTLFNSLAVLTYVLMFRRHHH